MIRLEIVGCWEVMLGFDFDTYTGIGILSTSDENETISTISISGDVRGGIWGGATGSCLGFG
jgi:hypothetical protein